MHRRLELDGRCLSRCHRVLAEALRGGQHLTRTELAYILMNAEFEALICSGPRKGRLLRETSDGKTY